MQQIDMQTQLIDETFSKLESEVLQDMSELLPQNKKKTQDILKWAYFNFTNKEDPASREQLNQKTQEYTKAIFQMVANNIVNIGSEIDSLFDTQNQQVEILTTQINSLTRVGLEDEEREIISNQIKSNQKNIV